MFVDRTAGQVVADGDCAVSAPAVECIDLLARPERKRDVPIILAGQFIQRFLCGCFLLLLLRDEVLEWEIAYRGRVERGDLRFSISPVCVQLDARGLQREEQDRKSVV